MSNINWEKILENILPHESNEALICTQFATRLIEALGFNQDEQIPQFQTGNGSVDFAVRPHTQNDKFCQSGKNPYLLLEVKARATGSGAKINLSEGTPQYLAVKAQIHKYLLAPKAQTAQWGIITNVDYIQLFRRHGKVVIPATKSLPIYKQNIDEIITRIKKNIENTPQALTVCIYNDKGGVGKTTTTINLAAILCKLQKKVLVVDFDPQQGDLTDSLGLGEGAVKLSDCLIDRTLNVEKTIQPFKLKGKLGKDIKLFDVIPSDSGLAKFMNYDEQAKIQKGSGRLRDVLQQFVHNYDYILIDAPTNWTFFSQSCVMASDVVLMPTKHSNFSSLKNSAKVIKQFIPEVQEVRQDGCPIALPIFFNEHKQTDASMKRTLSEIKSIISTKKADGSVLGDPTLLPYYWPKYTKSSPDTTIFSIPEYEIVSSAAFSKIPAVFKHKTAAQYYLDLAKEYFLYE